MCHGIVSIDNGIESSILVKVNLTLGVLVFMSRDACWKTSLLAGKLLSYMQFFWMNICIYIYAHLYIYLSYILHEGALISEREPSLKI